MKYFLLSTATIQGLTSLFNEIPGLLELSVIIGSELGSASFGAVCTASKAGRNHIISYWYDKCHQ